MREPATRQESVPEPDRVESSSHSSAERSLHRLDLRICVPSDCTEQDALGSIMAQGRRGIESCPKRLVLDLLSLRRMNCQLLSTIVYFGGECVRRGVGFMIVNAPAEFEAWVESHHLGTLIRRLSASPNGVPAGAAVAPATRSSRR
jgi:hypothetical protein